MARHRRAFNERHLDGWRELFDEDVELLVDGVPFRGVDAAVGYGIASVRQFPGLYIASERLVAASDDTIVVEVDLVTGDPASGHSRPQGTSCEIWVRDGRIVSDRSYYMPEPADRADAVRVPIRAEAAVVAEEQAALRRVATLVARGVSQDELFAAVTQETGCLVAADTTSLMRFEPDDTITLVAAWSARHADLPIGASRPMDEQLWSMREAGQPWRWGPADMPPAGPFVEEARTLGMRTFVGVPIVVDGRMWGVAFASSAADQPFADDAEARLAGFTELVATAIANAESRAALTRLAEEQAALRRVATLVAQGVSPAQIFSAVSDEVARLFKAQAAVLRFEHDDPGVVFVGVSKTLQLPVGTRWEFQPGMVSAEVHRTGCSARVDAMDWSSASGPVARAARRLGVVSTVASPIVVEGRLWGAITVASTDELLPFGMDARLEKFTELLATAIANAQSRSELAASRRRIVAASDEARRRIERDLHDGTQQRLVSLGLLVRAAEADAPAGGSDLHTGLSRIAAGLADAVAELQEFSRGIHPAVLSERGLGPALGMLARRCAVPVDLEVTTNARFPEPIEIAAYYVASETLANAMKHAQASRIDISLTTRNGSLLLSIRDDGVGGANPARGSGLVGLTDRVEALGGSIHLHSTADAGTQITADLPLEYELAPGAG
ncbi:MAG TPA: GAF domain-containing protein [Streptosporangiaceae bacterium]|nr:GAF domain-containing protein [Streptosporangiaceae bacterium]